MNLFNINKNVSKLWSSIIWLACLLINQGVGRSRILFRYRRFGRWNMWDSDVARDIRHTTYICVSSLVFASSETRLAPASSKSEEKYRKNTYTNKNTSHDDLLDNFCLFSNNFLRYLHAKSMFLIYWIGFIFSDFYSIRSDSWSNPSFGWKLTVIEKINI